VRRIASALLGLSLASMADIYLYESEYVSVRITPGSAGVIEATADATIKYIGGDFEWPLRTRLPPDREEVMSEERTAALPSLWLDILHAMPLQSLAALSLPDGEISLRAFANLSYSYEGVNENTMDLLGTEGLITGGGLVITLAGTDFHWPRSLTWVLRIALRALDASGILASIPGVAVTPVPCYPDRIAECEAGWQAARKTAWVSALTAVHLGMDTFNGTSLLPEAQLGEAAGAALVSYGSVVIDLHFQAELLVDFDCTQGARNYAGCSANFGDMTNGLTLSWIFECANMRIAFERVCQGLNTTEAWVFMVENAGIDPTFIPAFFEAAQADPAAYLSNEGGTDSWLKLQVSNNETIPEYLERNQWTMHDVFLDYVQFLLDQPFDAIRLRSRVQSAWEANSLRAAVPGTQGFEVFRTTGLRMMANGLYGALQAQLLFPLFAKPYLRAIAEGDPE